MKSKVSVVVTVFNEVKSIESLLTSFKSQTFKDYELVIVDAGSTDNTVLKVKQFCLRNPSFKTKLIIKKGVNRSVGRNLGIEKAQSSLIAVTDAGCVPKSNWLEQITKPLITKKAESVAGYYYPITKSVFQKCLAPFVAVMPYDFNPKTYLPSSRSISFTKIAWEVAGKYPENLNYCEDLIFAQNLKQKSKMIVVAEAIVAWQIPNSIMNYFKAIQNYAYGDIKAKYRPHQLKIASVYIRYLIFILMPPLFGVYLFYAIFKHKNTNQQLLSAIYMPLIQISTDMAIIFGSLRAFFS